MAIESACIEQCLRSIKYLNIYIEIMVCCVIADMLLQRACEELFVVTNYNVHFFIDHHPSTFAFYHTSYTSRLSINIFKMLIFSTIIPKIYAKVK
jgi:hypothetical protein